MSRSAYRLEWDEIKGDWPAWLLIVVSFAVGIWAYPHLPDRVPVHWNLRGEVNGYSSRFVAAFALPSLNFGIYFFLLVAPLIDPRRENYVHFIRFYRGFRQLVIAVMSLIYFVVIYAGLGHAIDVGWVVTLGVSVLFIFLGNSLGRVRHNYFVGIRTPWTLADERVWRWTNRLGGRLLVATGILPLLAVPFSRTLSLGLLVGGVAVSAIVSTIYSYLAYRRIHTR